MLTTPLTNWNAVVDPLQEEVYDAQALMERAFLEWNDFWSSEQDRAYQTAEARFASAVSTFISVRRLHPRYLSDAVR